VPLSMGGGHKGVGTLRWHHPDHASSSPITECHWLESALRGSGKRAGPEGQAAPAPLPTWRTPAPCSSTTVSSPSACPCTRYRATTPNLADVRKE